MCSTCATIRAACSIKRCQVSDDFLTSGEIVSTRGRHPEDTARYDAKPRRHHRRQARHRADQWRHRSASEIVAGALQDHKRATIVGMTSFGKGSVQTIIPLGESGGALRLTTARYFTPSGHSIQATGHHSRCGRGPRRRRRRRRPRSNVPAKPICRAIWTRESAARKRRRQIIHPLAGKKIDDFQLSYALDLLHGKTTVSSIAKPTDAN